MLMTFLCLYYPSKQTPWITAVEFTTLSFLPVFHPVHGQGRKALNVVNEMGLCLCLVIQLNSRGFRVHSDLNRVTTAIFVPGTQGFSPSVKFFTSLLTLNVQSSLKVNENTKNFIIH